MDKLADLERMVKRAQGPCSAPRGCDHCEAVYELERLPLADMVVQLAKVLAEWRATAYPCRATTCKEENRWHLKKEPDPGLMKRIDDALTALDKLEVI